MSFGVYFAAVFLGLAYHPEFGSGHPTDDMIPTYVHRLYDFSHSIIVFLLMFVFLWILLRRPVWEFTAWGFHILMDIPTHASQFFPTYFLWPISSFSINGYPWSLPEIFIPNVIGLSVAYAVWFLYRRRTAKPA